MHILAVAIGGALGASARYLVTGLPGFAGQRFPWGILIVNLVGCFLIGLVMQHTTTRVGGDDTLRIFVVVGFLGALTTFSTFGYDTLMLMRAGEMGLAALNVLANVVLGIGLVALGWQVGKWWLGSAGA